MVAEMTNLWKYREILLDLMLDLYGDTEDERVRQGIYEARETVYNSQPTIKWIKEREGK